MLYSSSLRIAAIAIVACGLLPSRVQAGPLIDWLFGRNKQPPAYAVGAPAPVGTANPYAMAYGAYQPNNPNPYAANYGAYPLGNFPSSGVAAPGFAAPGFAAPSIASAAPTGAMPGYAANYGAYYGSSLPVIGPAGAGYRTQMPSGITAATMPGTAMQGTAMPGMMPGTVAPTLSYVPNFNSYANRAAVTYYRPMLTTDPNTGAQVVAMAPCTSYEYQTQRVPTFGRSALFGSAAPPVASPTAPAFPTYTLPSGGIPIAGSTPSVLQPTLRSYGTYAAPPPMYSTYQPQMGQPQMGQPQGAVPGMYPTAPLGNTPYYGSNSGGSCGTFQSPSTVPGLVAPQGPATGYPSPGYASPGFSNPGFSNPSYPAPGSPAPGYSVPNFQSPSDSGPGVYPPPSGMPSADPAADSPPTLPPSFPTNTSNQTYLRPQVQGIVRQPLRSELPRDSNQQVGSSSSNPPVTPPTEAPSLMTPIPVPHGFEERPRWNPGLLQEGDMTARRPAGDERMAVAGQSKAIHWASFETDSRSANKVEVVGNDEGLTLAPSYNDNLAPSFNSNNRDNNIGSTWPSLENRATQPAAQPTNGLRSMQLSSPTVPPPSHRQGTQLPAGQLPAGQGQPTQSQPVQRQYDNTGWEVAR